MVYFVKDPATVYPLPVVTIIPIGMVPEKETKDCFADRSRYSYRDHCIDFLLPRSQPETAGCEIATLAPFGDATPAEWAEAFLRTLPGTSPEDIGKLLKAYGCVMTLTQVEVVMATSLVDRSKRNFAFLENKKGGVSFVYVTPDVDDHSGRLLVFLNRVLDNQRFSGIGNRLLIRKNGTALV